MLHLVRFDRSSQLLQVHQKLTLFITLAFESTCSLPHMTLDKEILVERVTRIINDHQFPDQPLHPTLSLHIPPSVLSTPFVENVLGRLFAAHSNGLKAFEFFKYSLRQPQFYPSSDAFEKTLHILTRMRYFDKAWELIEEIQRRNSSLLTLKSMSIMLSRVAKFRSYEDTLEAFGRMEKDIFVGRNFGTDEFNVLLRAFCTQRKMKEARSVFNKMHHRFSPNTKTMNILLLGFKESGDVTAVELFYHEMVRRGFQPNSVTYNIIIDAYCKKGCFGDALRLLGEMESRNCSPTLETMTTLIHGAGVARNTPKARELFNELPMRNLQPDIGAYNALMSSFLRSRDIMSAAGLMDEMEQKGVGHDNVTYHAMFLALIKLEGIDGVFKLYNKMKDRNFVPNSRTGVMLMKYFCENSWVDLGLELWEYLVERGYCPHGHALSLLVTALCSRGRVQEAFGCSKQMLERGRLMGEAVFRMLERSLLQAGDVEKLTELQQMAQRLQNVLPPSSENASGIPSPPI